MPTYDYECRSCGHNFETFQSMSDSPLITCPECRKDELKRLIGGGLGIIFKGSGFYVNDSRKSGSSTVSGTKSGSSSSSAAAAQSSTAAKAAEPSPAATGSAPASSDGKASA